MSESAPVGPVMSDEPARGGGWMRFVLPQPRAITVRDARRHLRHAAGESVAWAVVVAVAVALLAPVIGFAVAGGWALYTYANALLTLWHNVKTYQLSSLTPLLHALDVAARVALASAGYFALLSALIVLMAGLLGTRWRRLFLFPGITFTLPSALAFFFGLRLSLDVLSASLRVSGPAQTALLAYLLLDTILLAAALVDVSPRRRRSHRLRWLRWGRRRPPSTPLAPLRFGPSAPVTTDAPGIATAFAAMVVSSVADGETRPEVPVPDTSRRDAGATATLTPTPV